MTSWTTAQTMWWIARGRIIAVRREKDKDLGATALEWAIISGVLVAAALLIGNAIWQKVQSGQDKINDCSGQIC